MPKPYTSLSGCLLRLDPPHRLQAPPTWDPGTGLQLPAQWPQPQEAQALFTQGRQQSEDV